MIEDPDQPNIRLKRVIGAGCFGVVIEGIHVNLNQKCAIKRVPKVTSLLSREMEILKMIKGLENVISMERLFYTKDSSGLTQNLMFEYMESNLEHLIQKNIQEKTQLKQPFIKKCIYQLLNGLKNIHNYKVVHRDLKPQNVLVSDLGQIKICDFGSSKVLDESGKNTPFIVSRYYRAPELIFCISKYSTAVDIWAAGCILAQLYLMMPFFKGKTQGDQMFEITRILGGLSRAQKLYYKKKVPYEVTELNIFDEFKGEDLQQKFKMSKDRDNLLDLLQKMLRYNPQQRITAQQSLWHPYFNEIIDQIRY